MHLRTVFFVVAAWAVPLSAASAAGGPPAVDPSRSRGEAYYHLMRARLALADGKASEVAREVEAAIEEVPAEPDLQGEGALLLAMAGRRTDAESLARQALAANPDQPAALRVLADLAAARSFGPAADSDARTEAIRLYERLAAIDERSPDELWAVLARLKLGAGDRDGAVASAREFVSRRPGEPGAVRLLAQTLEAVDRKPEALEVLLEWVREHADEDGLIGWISEWAREVDRWPEVESAMSAVLERRPDAAAALGLRGEARLRLGRPVEAVSDLERAKAAAPESVLLRFQLATAYGAANRLHDATEAARALAADLPDNAAVGGMLGDALARQGDLQGAASAYASAAGVVPGSDSESTSRRDDLRIRQALVLIRDGDLAAAGRALGSVENRDHPEALEARAELAIREKAPARVKEIAASLRKAGEPGTGSYFEGQANLLEGRPDRALARFEEAAKDLGPSGRMRAAAALRDAGHPDRGERLLRDWVREEPGSAEARFQLGGYLERMADFERAEPLLREALKLAPEDPEILNYIGYSLADRGVRLDEAHELIRRAVAVDPWNGAFLDSLGWVLFRLGRLEEARDPLERAAKEMPFDATVLSHLGDLYERLGDPDGALDAWTRAIDAGAENADEIRAKAERLSRRIPAP